MTSVYIDYPVPHFSLKHDRTVEERVRHEKPDRRVVKITPETFQAEIGPFRRGEIRFGASRDLNDLWLEIDFNDEVFERHIAEYIQRLLGQRYVPLAQAEWR